MKEMGLLKEDNVKWVRGGRVEGMDLCIIERWVMEGGSLDGG